MIPDGILSDLRARLVATRLPDQLGGTEWSYGTDTTYLADLLAYWQDGYEQEIINPVTVVVRRTVKDRQQQGYERWLSALLEEVRDFPGYLGTEVQRPLPPNRTYISVFRFDTPENLERFEQSDLRRRHLAKIVPFIDSDANWDRLTGLEVWFSPPPGTVAAQPVRWRMVILIIATVFVLVEGLGALVGTVAPGLPGIARTALIVSIQVLLLTYVLLPWLTRTFRVWLFPLPKTEVPGLSNPQQETPR